MLRARAWHFVINNYTNDDVDGVLALPSDYLVFGFEVGKKKKTPHMQCYAYFNNARTQKSMKKLLPRAKLFVAKGTPEQNFDYNSKDGDYWEFGEKPSQGRAKWDSIVEAMENPKENIQLYHQYRKTYKEVLNLDKKDHERKVIAINSKRKYDVAKLCEATVFMDDDLECYENQEVMFITYYSSFRLEAWYNGFPPCIRRGYEIIKIDPSVVYILCENEQDFAAIRKKYSTIDIE